MLNWLKKHTRKLDIIPLVSLTFAGFAILVLYVSYSYKNYLGEIETVISEEAVESQKMRINSELMEIARSRTRFTSQVIDIDDPFEQDELNVQLDIFASRFAQLRNQLTSLPLRKEEKAMLDEHAKIVPVILPAQRQVVELAMSDDEEDDKKAEELFYSIVLPGQNKLIQSFGKLIEIEQTRIEELTKESHDSMAKVKNKSNIIIAMAMFFILIVTMVVILRIKIIQNALINSNRILEETVNKRTKALSKAESMLHSVLNTIPVRVFWKDLQGKYLGGNTHFIKDANLESEFELRNKTDYELPWKTNAVELQNEDSKVIETQNPILNISKPSTHEDGSTSWLEISKVPLINENNECIGILGTYQDITDRKTAEHKLKEAIESANTAAKAKTQFLATMSHEIRTPMNGVLGMAELLSTSKLSENQKEYVNAILNSGDLLLTIIDDILDFSKLDAGKVKLESIPVNMEELTHDILKILLPKCKNKDLELVLDYPLSTPNIFIGDPSRIRQILFNIVGNAIKFTHIGHIKISVNCNTRNRDTIVRIDIEDTGIGISEEQKEGLFKAFTQADSSTTRQFGGTGLGLAICKQLLELMNGSINVISTEGSGTTFSIEIPMALAEQDYVVYEHSLENFSILVINKQIESSKIICNTLEQLNASVTVCHDIESANTIINSSHANNQIFNLVIISEELIENNELYFKKHISTNEQLNHTPIILFTSSQHTLENFDRNIYSACLLNPVRLDLFKSALEKSLDIEIFSTQESGETAKDDSPVSTHLKRTFNGSILLAEDTIVNQKVATSMLNQIGLSVDIASDGLIAVNKWRENKYDLIFMDCRMPNMDGYEATKIIRSEEKNNTHIPIVALTANVTENDKNKCIESGMDDFISKPFKPDDLANCLSNFLDYSDLVEPDTNNTTLSSKSSEALQQIDIESFNKYRNLLKDDFSELIKAFCTSIDKIFTQLDQWDDRQDINELIRLPHSMKSCSANIGAIRLSKLAAECETLLNQNKKQDALDLVERLKLSYHETREELKKLGYEEFLS